VSQVELFIDFTTWGTFWDSIFAFAHQMVEKIKANIIKIIELMDDRKRRQIENLTAVGSWATEEIPEGNCVVTVGRILSEAREVMLMLSSQAAYTKQLADDMEAGAKAAASQALVDQLKETMLETAVQMDTRRDTDALEYNTKYGGDAKIGQMQEAVASISLDAVLNSSDVRNAMGMQGHLANFTRESTAREAKLMPWSQKLVYMLVSNHTCAEFACRGVKDCLHEAHNHIKSRLRMIINGTLKMCSAPNPPEHCKEPSPEIEEAARLMRQWDEAVVPLMAHFTRAGRRRRAKEIDGDGLDVAIAELGGALDVMEGFGVLQHPPPTTTTTTTATTATTTTIAGDSSAGNSSNSTFGPPPAAARGAGADTTTTPAPATTTAYVPAMRAFSFHSSAQHLLNVIEAPLCAQQGSASLASCSRDTASVFTVGATPGGGVNSTAAGAGSTGADAPFATVGEGVECTLGERLSRVDGADTCVACQTGKYMASPRHAEYFCETQPHCGEDERISAPSATSAQTCSPCADGTYMPHTYHRNATCSIAAARQALIVHFSVDECGPMTETDEDANKAAIENAVQTTAGLHANDFDGHTLACAGVDATDRRRQRRSETALVSTLTIAGGSNQTLVAVGLRVLEEAIEKGELAITFFFAGRSRQGVASHAMFRAQTGSVGGIRQLLGGALPVHRVAGAGAGATEAAGAGLPAESTGSDTTMMVAIAVPCAVVLLVLLAIGVWKSSAHASNKVAAAPTDSGDPDIDGHWAGPAQGGGKSSFSSGMFRMSTDGGSSSVAGGLPQLPTLPTLHGLSREQELAARAAGAAPAGPRNSWSFAAGLVDGLSSSNAPRLANVVGDLVARDDAVAPDPRRRTSSFFASLFDGLSSTGNDAAPAPGRRRSTADVVVGDVTMTGFSNAEVASTSVAARPNSAGRHGARAGNGGQWHTPHSGTPAAGAGSTRNPRKHQPQARTRQQAAPRLSELPVFLPGTTDA